MRERVEIKIAVLLVLWAGALYCALAGLAQLTEPPPDPADRMCWEDEGEPLCEEEPPVCEPDPWPDDFI